jgi:hypothetical protein
MISRKTALLFAAAVSCAAWLGLSTSSYNAAQTSDRENQHHERRKGLGKIRHIVFIVKKTALSIIILGLSRAPMARHPEKFQRAR